MENQSSVVGLQSSDSVVGRWPLAPAILIAFCLFLLSVSALAQQKTVVLKGGKLLTVSHGVVENGVLVMSGARSLRLARLDRWRFPRMRRSSTSPA